jgi:hypothetical protein
MERFLTVGGRTVKIPVLQVELLKQWWGREKRSFGAPISFCFFFFVPFSTPPLTVEKPYPKYFWANTLSNSDSTHMRLDCEVS